MSSNSLQGINQLTDFNSFLSGLTPAQKRQEEGCYLSDPNNTCYRLDAIVSRFREIAGENNSDLAKAINSKIVSFRNQKNREIARTQGGNEKDKGFSFDADLSLMETISVWCARRIVRQSITSRIIEIGDRKVGAASCQGMRREMEDGDIVTALNFTINGKTRTAELYGVFDGHNGKEACDFTKKLLPSYLKSALEENGEFSEQTVWGAIKTAFKKLDADFEGESGTTAAVVLILEGFLWVANVGDCRIVLEKNGSSEQLTEDAKPEIPRYRKKIEKNGGEVFQNIDGKTEEAVGPHRVFGKYTQVGLAPARAIGDKEFGKVVSASPKIAYQPLIHEGYLVIACDGLWDVSSSKEVVQALEVMKAQKKSENEMAHLLVQRAIELGSTDNVSVIVVKLS